ncbi:retrovirus-related pol polyprotein from transposon TNT 1-94 [Tanacetum coccineum]
MDFTVWKMTIEDVLVQQGINEALEEKQPAEMKDDVWKTMQKKASSTIRLFLKMELYSLKLEEGSNLHDHINSFNQLVCQLANVDDAIKDEEQALLMLSSLPKSYKPFVQTMLTGRTTLTFEDVLKALRDNERMTGNDSSSSSDKLLLADDSGRGRNFQRGSSKGRSKSRMGGDRDMSVVECYYCGDKGHMQVRCPQFREDLKSLRDSKGKKKVDGGEMNVVDNGGDEFLMTETPMDGILREEKPKWVLDNAASSHICNDRAMFETLNDKGQFGEIKVGSKQMMKIEGVGSVRFKLHDGSVKTALNVKYVPGAARNILSLGVLTSRGYRYVGRKDTCKVYKRDQLVIRGRKIPNNLCYLEGEALQGRTCCGGNKGKKKIEKRVHFSDKDEHPIPVWTPVAPPGHQIPLRTFAALLHGLIKGQKEIACANGPRLSKENLAHLGCLWTLLQETKSYVFNNKLNRNLLHDCERLSQLQGGGGVNSRFAPTFFIDEGLH